LDLRNSIG
jgi:hypothetical protein